MLEAPQGKLVRMTDIAKRAGISRQALYLHFDNRAELLIATTQYIDVVKGVDDRLAKSRAAKTGRERLAAYIDAWGNYIPEIYGVGKALLAVQDTDEAAAAAWSDRMQAVRHGCEAAVSALDADGHLAPEFSIEKATDILWTMLSVRNWEQLTRECGWSQDAYIRFVKHQSEAVLCCGRL